ncbi:MAG: MarR family transcriptional regulator [Candidatus Doudnabacteria bacterium]|nr:MarR family transcriptional regulator [Candidatus Doudnabacteria bacterium]
MQKLELSPLRKLFHTVILLSKKDMVRRFAETNIHLSQLQFWVLVTIREHPTTLNEIAKKFGIKPPSLTPVVRMLEKTGYLQKKPDAHDGRKFQLINTKKGEQVLNKLPLNTSKDALNAAFEKLTSTKQRQLLKLLEELISNFEYHE